MSINLKTILIDLTPVLPGGTNGGAKIFALKLISCMASANLQTKFILLTKACSYQELAYMDSINVSRIMIGGTTTNNKSLSTKIIGFAFKKIPNIPNQISLLGYKIIAKLRRYSHRKLLAEINPDLIFCPFTAPTFAMANIPLVSVIYDLQYKTHPDFFTKADVKNRDHTFTEACRVATKLVAISEYSRQSAILHGKINGDKIQTIHLYMANRNKFENAEHNNAILEQFGLKKQQYFIYPANFWPHKNHEMLLKAFKIAKRNNPIMHDIKLVCTGAPSTRQKFLISTAKEMGLESEVLFVDFLKDSDLASLMQNCKAFIFPSLYEGFGLPVLEAMAFDVPVACSNITSLPEVAADAALFFDPKSPGAIANAMLELVKNPSICEKLIHAGRERVKMFFDSNQMAKQYWTLFESLKA